MPMLGSEPEWLDDMGYDDYNKARNCWERQFNELRTAIESAMPMRRKQTSRSFANLVVRNGFDDLDELKAILAAEIDTISKWTPGALADACFALGLPEHLPEIRKTEKFISYLEGELSRAKARLKQLKSN